MLRPGEEEHWGGEEPTPVGSPVIERRGRRFGTVFCRCRSTGRRPKRGGRVGSVALRGRRKGWAGGGGRRRRVVARERGWGKVWRQHRVSSVVESHSGGEGARRRGVGGRRLRVDAAARWRWSAGGGDGRRGRRAFFFFSLGMYRFGLTYMRSAGRIT